MKVKYLNAFILLLTAGTAYQFSNSITPASNNHEAKLQARSPPTGGSPGSRKRPPSPPPLAGSEQGLTGPATNVPPAAPPQSARNLSSRRKPQPKHLLDQARKAAAAATAHAFIASQPVSARTRNRIKTSPQIQQSQQLEVLGTKSPIPKPEGSIPAQALRNHSPPKQIMKMTPLSEMSPPRHQSSAQSGHGLGLMTSRQASQDGVGTVHTVRPLSDAHPVPEPHNTATPMDSRNTQLDRSLMPPPLSHSAVAGPSTRQPPARQTNLHASQADQNAPNRDHARAPVPRYFRSRGIRDPSLPEVRGQSPPPSGDGWRLNEGTFSNRQVTKSKPALPLPDAAEGNRAQILHEGPSNTRVMTHYRKRSNSRINAGQSVKKAVTLSDQRSIDLSVRTQQDGKHTAEIVGKHIKAIGMVIGYNSRVTMEGNGQRHELDQPGQRHVIQFSRDEARLNTKSEGDASVVAAASTKPFGNEVGWEQRWVQP